METVGVPELLKQAKAMGKGIIVMKPLAGGALRNVNLALRYILEHDVTTVIPGMDSLQQVEENACEGFALQPLTADEEMRWMKVKTLGGAFCRRCEYCKPCSQRIDIPTVSCWTAITRYNLQDWAGERYRALKPGWMPAQAAANARKVPTTCPSGGCWPKRQPG